MKMQTVKLKELEKIVKYTMEKGLTIYIEGRSGIGKSQVVHSVAKKLGKKVVDIRAVLYDLGDIVMKVPDKNNTELKEIVTTMLPREKGYVIFLDEFRHAPNEIRRMFYQLILDKKLSSYELPEGTPIIAASNFTEEVETEELEGPLFDRWVFRVRVEENFEDWKRFMIEEVPGSSRVVAYLENFREDFYVTDNTGVVLVSPRRWEMVINNLSMAKYILPPFVATRFEEFNRKVDMFRDLDKYVKGEKEFPEDLSDQYALATAIINKLENEKDYEKFMENILDLKFKGINEEIKAFLVFQTLSVFKRRKRAKELYDILIKAKNHQKILDVLQEYRYISE